MAKALKKTCEWCGRGIYEGLYANCIDRRSAKSIIGVNPKTNLRFKLTLRPKWPGSIRSTLEDDTVCFKCLKPLMLKILRVKRGEDSLSSQE